MSYFVSLQLEEAARDWNYRETDIQRIILQFKGYYHGWDLFLVLIFLLTWGITYEIYKDHEALKNRISILHKERNNYKNELENLKKKPQVEPTKKKTFRIILENG